MPPHPAWCAQLRADLDARAQAHQLRALTPVQSPGPIVRIAGQDLINLASNDYLGLSQHPRLRQAAIDAITAWGVGSASARLVGGHLQLHEDVEARFAAFKHAPAALICPTGYMANHAVVTTLAREGDLICLDKLCHASLIDAARASGATVRVYPHLGYDKLARLLKTELPAPASDGAPPPRPPRRLILTDSVFSMDGDCADLPAICTLAEKHHAIVVVDEAHGTGVLGDTGAGLCEAQGVSDRVDVVISTASKALGGLGGIITARREVIQSIINHARSFIYTTSTPPAQVAAIAAALDVIRDEPQRRARLLDLSRRVRAELHRLNLPTIAPPSDDRLQTPIIPIIAGAAEDALNLAAHLRSHGLYAPAIRPPTVPPGSARVRLSLRADLEDDHLARLSDALQAWINR